MSDVFDVSKTFAQFDLREELVRGLNDLGFKHPTYIQSAMIPAALTGIDLLGQAKTGTGKTAAFGLPILNNADPHLPGQALILAPTRELALQIAGEINRFAEHTPLRAVAIIGGESMNQQVRELSAGAQIMVGTPGRVMDLHRRRQLPFENVRYVVLDEVDRMLDIGFREDIRKILGSIHTPHQTIFVSATIAPEIEKLARQFMRRNAEKIQTVANALTAARVQQRCIAVEPREKKRMLVNLLKNEEAACTVVFCRTKRTVRDVAKYLTAHGIDAKEIHGDLEQKRRNSVMKRMRAGQLDVLVASDVAARGLDVDGITHVINYDLPEDPEVYVHRIGRTARAGRAGQAWSFVAPGQGPLLTAIEKLTGVLIEDFRLPDSPAGSAHTPRTSEGPDAPAPREPQRDRRRERPEREPRPAQDVSTGEGATHAAVLAEPTPMPTPTAVDAAPAAKSAEPEPEILTAARCAELGLPAILVGKPLPRKTLGSRFRRR